MVARCEKVGKYVLPLFRSLVAKELINNYNLTQVEVAQRLGTTQAAISQYVNSKRAIKGAEQFVDGMPKIQVMVKNIVKRLANKETNWDEITLDFCKVCLTFQDGESKLSGNNCGM